MSCHMATSRGIELGAFQLYCHACDEYYAGEYTAKRPEKIKGDWWTIPSHLKLRAHNAAAKSLD